MKKIHAEQEARAVGHAEAGCRVGEVAELQLVDGPALSADVDPHIHCKGSPELVVGSLDPERMRRMSFEMLNRFAFNSGLHMDEAGKVPRLAHESQFKVRQHDSWAYLRGRPNQGN